MGQSIINPVKMFLVGFVLSVLICQIKSQEDPPPFHKLGCPDPEVTLEFPLACPTPMLNCVPTPTEWPNQFDNRHRGSIYRKIRTRSWWFCGMACDPTTPCKFWTFRHATRECYLMKTCCLSIGQDVAGFQSGKAGACPNLEGTTTAALGGGDW